METFGKFLDAINTNNGGGRDMYISDNAGGLKTMYQPAGFKRTFYNNLRSYEPVDNYSKRGKSHTASFEEKNDVFSQSQDHWNKGFRREMRLVSNYQKMLDLRLSKPKSLQKIKMEANKNKDERVYRNSALRE